MGICWLDFMLNCGLLGFACKLIGHSFIHYNHPQTHSAKSCNLQHVFKRQNKKTTYPKSKPNWTRSTRQSGKQGNEYLYLRKMPDLLWNGRNKSFNCILLGGQMKIHLYQYFLHFRLACICPSSASITESCRMVVVGRNICRSAGSFTLLRAGPMRAGGSRLRPVWFWASPSMELP